ncbi:MAG TPA: HD domain-containing protein [Candidatus Aminicenantes bacterium]|nr:HD domain-containing protein [Candidatus Aminicenantes bacterium]HPT00222.1 HD domain-containing protein [Candidatus Aminicenantes bacterium]
MTEYRDSPAAEFWESFFSYVQRFPFPAEEVREAATLKVDHTLRVADSSLAIAQELSLPPRELLLVETSAIFHDLGRFPQLHRYNTFRDSLSQDHALLGYRALKREDFLKGLMPEEKNGIYQAVLLHNRLSIPEAVPERVKILRDADKLDVLGVLVELYLSPAKNPLVALELPENPGYNPALLAGFREHHSSSFQNLTCLNDLRLGHLSWVFDISYPWTLREILRREYLETLLSLLPKDGGTQEAREAVDTELIRRLGIGLKESRP